MKNILKELIDQAELLAGKRTSEEIAEYLAKNNVVPFPVGVGDKVWFIVARGTFPGYMSEWGRKLTAAIKEDLMDEINAIPPTQQWIPVSDSPKKDGRYQVTRLDCVTDTKFIDILWYEKNTWWNRQATGDYAVIAWMHLPEPYAPTQSNDSKALDALGKGEK